MGGVVLGADAFPYLASQQGRHRGTQRRRACQALVKRGSYRCRPFSDELARGVAQLAPGNRQVHQPDSPGRFPTEVACREHQLHGLQMADQPHAAHGSAETGEDP